MPLTIEVSGLIVQESMTQEREKRYSRESALLLLAGNCTFERRQLRSMGRIDASDAFPAGELHHVWCLGAMTRAIAMEEGVEEGMLVLNFVAVSDVVVPGPWAGSYLVFVNANCNTGTLTVVARGLYKLEGAAGDLIDFERFSPHIRIDKPNAPWTKAVQAICEQRLMQPTYEDYLNCVTRGVEKCDDLVNCVSGGKRQWTNRSNCD
jgi:hypothetical protein